MPEHADIVVVHDAARPLALPALFDAVVDPLLHGRADGAACAVAVADTLKRLDADGATVTGTVERNGLVAVQTPQAFLAPVLRRVHAEGAEATDDAALVERAGGVVHVVPGDPRNVKLTVPEDLELAELLLTLRRTREPG